MVAALHGIAADGPDLKALFARHQGVVLAFSGGKDSLVCLHLCRHYQDKLTVVWVNTGAMFPHMREFIYKATVGFDFVELKSDQAGWIEQYGFPSDVVSVANSIWRDPGAPDPPPTMTQPWTSCCAKLRFSPILDYLAQSGATLFIHGQRDSDGGGLSGDSQPGATVEIHKLIWEWSERDIMAYIDENKIELPDQYAHGVVGSLECWSCTARAGDSAAKVEARLAYMKKQYPDLFEKLKLRIAKVYLATEAAFKEMKADTTYAWLEAADANVASQQDESGPESVMRHPR
ncbi:MAG: phosphoadenosine phosphosulfate reductase family protein, partial [Alphaproteobacteria bacterium]|nr:phosphoadenosine phosphosulfate reductase family protein [Alphaproteobacteria bacterium]